MLDGRVLGASQAEYKPFGKPPLRERCLFCVRAFARRSLQLSLQSLRSSRSSRLNSTRNSTRAATKKWLVPVSSRALTRQPAESYGSYGSYGHTVTRSYGGLALRHLPRLPGIEASRAAPPAQHRSLQPAEPAPGNLN